MDLPSWASCLRRRRRAGRHRVVRRLRGERVRRARGVIRVPGVRVVTPDDRRFALTYIALGLAIFAVAALGEVCR